MAEHRAVRMGIDVGGTYTKCVAMDNLTHEIIAKNEVRRVLTVGLAQLKNTFAGQAVSNYHEIMAGAVLAIIPVVILFLIFQKYMMTGYSKAAMK